MKDFDDESLKLIAQFPTLEDSDHVLAMSPEELDEKLRAIEHEISLFEKVRPLDESESAATHSEKRQFNWLIGWENFQDSLASSCQSQSEMFKKESETQTYLALSAIYKNCGDQILSDENYDKAKIAAFECGCLLASVHADGKNQDIPELFSDQVIQAKLSDGFQSVS